MDSFGMLTKSTWVPDTVSLNTSTCVYSLLSEGISSPFRQVFQLAHILKVFLLFVFIACGKGTFLKLGGGEGEVSEDDCKQRK